MNKISKICYSAIVVCSLSWSSAFAKDFSGIINITEDVARIVNDLTALSNNVKTSPNIKSDAKNIVASIQKFKNNIKYNKNRTWLEFAKEMYDDIDTILKNSEDLRKALKSDASLQSDASKIYTDVRALKSEIRSIILHRHSSN